MDYKDILGNRINQLEGLLATHKDSLEDDVRNKINMLISYVRTNLDGRLDGLDYDVRDASIMKMHNEIDEALKILEMKFPETSRDDR